MYFKYIAVQYVYDIYVKNCSVYIQCKGDIVVVDIKQHKSQFKKFKLYPVSYTHLTLPTNREV